MTEFEDRVNRGEASYQELSLGGRTASGLPQYDLVSGMGDWVTASLFGEGVGTARTAEEDAEHRLR